MANVAAPYGLQPFLNMITGDTNFPTFTIGYTADINRALAKGDPISIGAGALGIPSATPTTTRSGNSPAGVVTGITFRPPTNPGSLAGHGKTLPANAITAGYTSVRIEYIASPFVVWKIQASAATGASTAIGKNAALVMTAAANGISQITLDASTINTTNTLAVRILDFAPGSGPTDPFPDYLVVWNTGVHPLQNATGV